ncbi:hypothetical protein [Oscillatoria sp. FACHB-1406]|uniref:hypothetical protein n=1 Tax=Oscillatoria sp. FACHB-1406 TaxID=2692846 RepID=UPI0016862F50|nr:hypothetical protein [Oscillatoria sp. FACHB-1406]MBD2578145.1 hypothetical protein [Oscillatoria sp. FACHB-1406]
MTIVIDYKSFLNRDRIAHNIETDADVGATFHLEPNHQPRAGETARVWFALTHRGGEPIPLEACNCQLTVYDSSTTPFKKIIEPNLSAIDVERYRSIPAASFEFPTAGLYQVELKGTPKKAGEFQAFRLSYPVTVSPSSRTEVSPTTAIIVKTPTSSERGFEWPSIGVAIAIIFFVSSVVFTLRKRF